MFDPAELLRTISDSIKNSVASVENTNLTEIFGRFLNEVGDNNYSAVRYAIVLNMTHYMYNVSYGPSDNLPGVPSPLGYAGIA